MSAPDFWRSCGRELLEQDARGKLVVTDDFLRAYFLRPEMLPPEEACEAEQALHRMLLEEPRHPLAPAEISGLTDPDAVDNYRVLLAFRDRLLDHATLEEAYFALVQTPDPSIAPLFIDQLAHVILRNILADSEDPFEACAAELFFREQRITLHDGQILVADDERIEQSASQPQAVSLKDFLEHPAPQRALELDILSRENAGLYWSRSDSFDFVLDLTFTRPGLDAFCRVMEKWIRHFLDLETRITPVQSIADQAWRWHTGLDRDSSALLNALYRGEDPPGTTQDEALTRLLSLFRMEFAEETSILEEMAGRPVYLGLAMDHQNKLRMKPQNLLLNLPLRAAD
jgi:hypothetical protein